ncbi:MAG: DNA-binding protein [Desulfobacteraceae bacterium]|nr:MAG: DNA-binding protein [Desulfobacteraceae bacterium]
MKIQKKFHTIAGVAELLAVSEKSVRRLIDVEIIPCVMSTIGPRIHRDDLLGYVQNILNQYAEEETGQLPKEIRENPQLITIEAAQCALDCSRSKVRNLIEVGAVAACRVGRLIRILAESMEQFQSEKIFQFIKKSTVR